MPNIESIRLDPLITGPDHYFVGPEREGPAVTVRVQQHDTHTQLAQHISSISYYRRPPHAGEDYTAWVLDTNADDSLRTHVQMRLRASQIMDGAPTVRLSLDVVPPLQDPEHVRKAAKVLGRHILASRQDPNAPNTIGADLVAMGVPFDSVTVTKVVTEILGTRRVNSLPRL